MPELASLLVMALAVSSDNFAAALALATLGQGGRAWRVVLVFTLFGFLAPLLGLWLGQVLSERLAGIAEWLSVSLLLALGLWTLYSAWRGGASEARAQAATSWGGLVLLAAGLSLDNLIAGFGLGLRGVPPLALAATSAAVVAVLSALGLALGGEARRHWERRAVLAAGALLVALALALAFGWLPT